MPKILVNDGISSNGKEKLETAGFQVDTEKVPQEDLVNALKNYDAVLVRSATKIRKDIIDACPNLKLIGRGGVGLDNIDVEYAKSKGIEVINTPAASSRSVAELTFAHLFGMIRFIHDANRQMPDKGSSNFKELKKQYSKGKELQGKTMGIIGLGRIGQETAKIAFGIGMNVIGHDPVVKEVNIKLGFPNGSHVEIPIKSTGKEDVLKNADFISIHTPFIKEQGSVITKSDYNLMKDNVVIVNCARGGVIKEEDLLEALNSGKVAYAGIDVFEEEPTNNTALLNHPNVSLTPHIGASTVEAQERIGTELADKVIAFFNNK